VLSTEVREAAMKVRLFLSMFVLSAVLATPLGAQEYGLYVRVVGEINGTFEDAVKSSEEALGRSGWRILASYPNAVPETCTLKAHTIVVHSPEYAERILAPGPRAAFALPLRVGIYEDESGVNIAFVNPASLNRTVLGDDTAKELSLKTMNDLSRILASGVRGRLVNEQMGQIRSKGKVGGMGGGDFDKKIEEIYISEFSSSAFEETARKVKEGIVANKEGWQLIYSLELADKKIVIYGVNKKEMETRAYKIAGEKRESKNNSCPGIDHVSAFPIEVIVYSEAGLVKVVTLDEMYRMKLYFEDAGMWAFMKNMRMPGEIEDEIVEMSTSLLKE